MAFLCAGPSAVSQPTPTVEADVAAALGFVHGPRGLAHLADPALLDRMRANPDAYRTQIEVEVDALDGSVTLLALDRRRLLLELAYTISPEVALPVARRVLAQALPLVRPLSLEDQASPNDREVTGDRVLSLAYLVGGALGVTADLEDTSYAVAALDLTRNFSEPGPTWPVAPVLYHATYEYLEAVADVLPVAESVEPVAVCASTTSDGIVVGHFGARTDSDVVVYVPRGPNNRFVSSAGRTIPQVPSQFFRDVGDEPVPSFVTVVYPEPGETITWEILGRTATLGADATPCPVVYPDRFPVTVPLCDGLEATTFISAAGAIIGGLDGGQPYAGTLTGTPGPDVMVGTAAADTLLALDGDDVVCGLEGDDVIDGGEGADKLFGLEGDDTLDGGPGLDEVDGGDGDDACGGDFDFVLRCERPLGPTGPVCDGRAATIYVLDGLVVGGPSDGQFYGGTLIGTDGPDVIVGTPGDDRLVGLEGDDVLCGVFGADELDGGPGADTLVADDGSGVIGPVELGGPPGGFLVRPGPDDMLRGGDGDDSLLAGIGDDRAEGGPGDDFLFGQEGDDVLEGGPGIDEAIGGSGFDQCDAESETDCEDPVDLPVLACAGLEATVYVSADGSIVGGRDDGSPFSGTLTGTTGRDVIIGTAAADTLVGLQGDDVLCGLEGDDVLRGSAGADSLYGGAGHDELRGDNGSDALYGGDGDDDLLGGNDADVLEGESGDDFLRGAAGNDTLLGGPGNDTLLGNADDDDLRGGPGDDALEGGSGDDTLVGDADTDTASGGGGIDACEAETEVSCETDPE